MEHAEKQHACHGGAIPAVAAEELGDCADGCRIFLRTDGGNFGIAQQKQNAQYPEENQQDQHPGKPQGRDHMAQDQSNQCGSNGADASGNAEADAVISLIIANVQGVQQGHHGIGTPQTQTVEQS